MTSAGDAVNRRSFLTAVARKWNVMYAVMLRDMRTRFFNHGMGFLVVAMWPLAHLFILLFVYQLIGRTAPYGETLFIFFATALIPTLAFMYVSRFMAMSLVVNKPMMSFPVVHASDILLGRALLEIIASCIMVILTLLVLTVLGVDPMPHDLAAAASAFAAVLLLAVGVGILVGVIALLFPMVVTIYTLITIGVYLLSGTLFVASALPPELIRVLSWNPVLHATEWMRTAYFLGYPDRVLDTTYLIGFALVSVFLGLFFERIVRPLVH